MILGDCRREPPSIPIIADPSIKRQMPCELFACVSLKANPKATDSVLEAKPTKTELSMNKNRFIDDNRQHSE